MEMVYYVIQTFASITLTVTIDYYILSLLTPDLILRAMLDLFSVLFCFCLFLFLLVCLFSVCLFVCFLLKVKTLYVTQINQYKVIGLILLSNPD